MVRIKTTFTINLVQRFNFTLGMYLLDGMNSNYTCSITIFSIFIIFVLLLCYLKQLHILAKIAQTLKQSTGPIPFPIYSKFRVICSILQIRFTKRLPQWYKVPFLNLEFFLICNFTNCIIYGGQYSTAVGIKNCFM